MRIRTVLLLVVTFGAGAASQRLLADAQSRTAVPDALTAAPNEYHLEFENEYVRVMRIRYPAHFKAVVHAHTAPGGVIVALTDQDARVTGLDNSTRELHFKAGQARWAAATPGVDRSTYSALAEENLSDRPFELIRVDPKVGACR